MFETSILKSLPENSKYVFQTTEMPCTRPLSKSAFLASNPTGNLTLIANGDNSKDYFEIWSMFNGWNSDAYKEFMSGFMRLISNNFKIESRYVENLIILGFAPFDGANEWLKQNKQSYRLTGNRKGIVHIEFRDNHQSTYKIRVSTISNNYGVAEVRTPKGDTYTAKWLGDIATTIMSATNSKNSQSYQSFNENLLTDWQDMPNLIGHKTTLNPL